MLDRILEALTAHHLAILGKTGMGKTWVAKVLVEYELEHEHRVVILDPTGVWWGLKAAADGQAAGFPVAVLGGDHADRPLLPTQGREIARILAGANLPTVLDVADWTKGEQERFVCDFAEEIYTANRGTALRLVIDEADAFAPQGSAPDQRQMFGYIDRIVRRGRSRGLYVTLISQRPAVLHKNVLSQVDGLVVLGVTAPQDRKAILAWVEGNTNSKAEATAFTDSLPALQRGTGWAWAPKAGFLEQVRWPAIKTFDSGRTPKHGETIMPPQTLASVDLSALDHVPDAGEKVTADAPPARQVDPAELQRARDEGYADGFRKGRAEGERLGRADGVARARGFIARAMEALDAEATITAGCVGKVNDVHFSDHERGGENEHAAPAPKAPTAPKRATPVDLPAGDLPTSARKLLAELAARAPLAFSWTQIATLAGLKARGGSFNTGRKALRDGGLITEQGSLVKLSDAGIKLVGVDDGTRRKRRTPAEVIEDWCSKLPAPAPDMLRALVAAGPLDRVALGQRLGKAPRGGSFNTGIATLRRNGLVTEDGGRLTAAAELRG